MRLLFLSSKCHLSLCRVNIGMNALMSTFTLITRLLTGSTEAYSQLTKKQLIWCLQFGGCKNLGSKDFNVRKVDGRFEVPLNDCDL